MCVCRDTSTSSQQRKPVSRDPAPSNIKSGVNTFTLHSLITKLSLQCGRTFHLCSISIYFSLIPHVFVYLFQGKFTVTPSQSTLKYGTENNPWMRGLTNKYTSGQVTTRRREAREENFSEIAKGLQKSEGETCAEANLNQRL